MEHIQKYSEIKVRWLIPLFPLAIMTSRIINALVAGLMNTSTADPVVTIAFRVYTSSFWFIVIGVVLAKSKLSLKTFAGEPPGFHMWFWILMIFPLYINARILTPIYSNFITQFLPTFAEYLDGLHSIPVIFNLTNQTHSAIFNSISGLFLVIIIPIYEEALFRGIILNRWIYKFGVSKSVALTSLLFGLLHSKSIFPSFVSSVIFSILRIKSKGLYIPTLTHMLYNGFIFWLIIR